MLKTDNSGVTCVFGAFELIHTFVCKKKMAMILLKILDAALQNIDALASRWPGFVHPWWKTCR
jgi:hypothetical protein